MYNAYLSVRFRVYGFDARTVRGSEVATDNNPVQNLLQILESCNVPNALVLNIEDIRSLGYYYHRNPEMSGKLNDLITVRGDNSCNTYIINRDFFNQGAAEYGLPGFSNV